MRGEGPDRYTYKCIGFNTNSSKDTLFAVDEGYSMCPTLTGSDSTLG